jgi:hypothetical protein
MSLCDSEAPVVLKTPRQVPIGRRCLAEEERRYTKAEAIHLKGTCNDVFVFRHPR